MSAIYFVRHGQSEMNRAKRWAGRTDTPLTQTGHEQARQTGKQLKQQGLIFDCILTSPLSRAHDTAIHIAEETGYDPSKIIVSDLLTERYFGELEGTSLLSLSKAGTKYLLGDESALDGIKDIETIDQLQRRAKQAADYLRTLPGDTILVVAHRAYGRALRRAFTNDTSYKRGQDYDNAEIVRLV